MITWPWPRESDWKWTRDFRISIGDFWFPAKNNQLPFIERSLDWGWGGREWEEWEDRGFEGLKSQRAQICDVIHCQSCDPLPVLWSTASLVIHCQSSDPLPVLWSTDSLVFHCQRFYSRERDSIVQYVRWSVHRTICQWVLSSRKLEYHHLKSTFSPSSTNGWNDPCS